jgi:hypothetical protein
VTTSGDQTHCRRCFGVLVASPVGAAFCDSCGSGNLLRFRVCSTCGKKRAGQKEATPVAEGERDTQERSSKEKAAGTLPLPPPVPKGSEKEDEVAKRVSADKPPMPAKPAAAKMAALMSKVKLELQTRHSAGVVMVRACCRRQMRY